MRSNSQPHEHTIADGRYTRTLQRDNGVLVWRVSMTRMSDNASITYTERWSLSDGGRTLTIYTAYPSNIDVVRVFAKK